MHTRLFSCAIVFGVLYALPGHAATALEGVSVPATRNVGGTTVMLNGLGLRLATMLKVKVYVMALYLETRESDAARIIDSDEAARIELHMLRDVGAKDMHKAWSEGFDKNYQGPADLAANLETLKSATGDLKEGDVMAFDFSGDKVTVSHNGKPQATIDGTEFRRALMSVWLGKNPPNKEVKQGILGRSD